MRTLRDGDRKRRGFTLIELIVVLAIVAMLLSVALPRYFHSIDTAKEAVLAENLSLVRATIDKFYADKGRYPDSLSELVGENYLRALPVDPVTGSAESWVIVAPTRAGAKGSVYDLKSGAAGATRAGKAFADF